MPPMIKFWLSTLKEGKSIDSTAFQSMISDILEFCATYTKSDSEAHAFYHDTKDPTRVLMITGYPSQELNAEADKIYAERFLPRMFDQVQHTWLKQLDMSIAEIHLEDNLIVAYGKEPSAWVDRGTGGWDVWPSTPQGKQAAAKIQGSVRPEMENQMWLQIAAWNGKIEDSKVPRDGEKLLVKKIISR
ncbi:uncharacterized protein N7443_000831 [Penicillium atrosanguineum]|uniref:Uncharacterized protein n=1 Tax=Penicillium atrosanguineum TaxID=1132637 RepID=A0A9W9QHM2_9EURO|nr:uncharacterized protein N7443_000831 [Penicillium atrosanguineum]KAJ5313947.1 hypothetical protein N7443_000831 [Penicillium atrosanguineum]KAJ5331117.1 hypothetical protein N7476_000900 [Penicillium atrosanguineum]